MAYSSDFLDEARIQSAIESSVNPDREKVVSILHKALEKKGLTIEETAVLLNVEDKELLAEIFTAARRIKEEIYGNRIVLFAPLYLSNFCINNCRYCAFRRDNKELARIALDVEDIKQETRILLDKGHKRLLLVFGEHPKHSNLEYIEMCVKTVYAQSDGKKSAIRRVNINAAPLTVAEFKELKTYGIGTFQCFQETYHRETYAYMHPSGPKADYDYRLTTMHRALEGGIDDIGIGVLYGLYDYKFETLAMLMHAQDLDERFGVGPHTVSVPRIEPALNAPAAMAPPAPVNDDEFRKLIAVIRLALPYTGMILSTRETAEFRNEAIALGISQVSAGSRTNPGGYKEAVENDEMTEQFMIFDTRELDTMMEYLAKSGYMPSMCTACYRLGRTGEDFMGEAKSGHIHTYCLPNAILTFLEYVQDFGTPELKQLAEDVIASQIDKVEPELREALKEKIEQIRQGERDLYF